MHVFDVGEVTVVFITSKQRSAVDSNPTGEIKGAGYKSRHFPSSLSTANKNIYRNKKTLVLLEFLTSSDFLRSKKLVFLRCGGHRRHDKI